MQEYTDKKALVTEIKKTADIFIREFEDVAEIDRDIRFDEVDRTPQQNS